MMLIQRLRRLSAFAALALLGGLSACTTLERPPRQGPAQAPRAATTITPTSVTNAPASGATTPAPPAVDRASYRIQPGDSLSIEVFQEPDISRACTVQPDGFIRHPLLGRVLLKGATVAEAEQKLEELLGKDYLVNPRVVISLTQVTAQRVIVLGEINKPGDYTIGPGEKLTLLQVIARAGGFTNIAAKDRVRVTRFMKGVRTTVNVDADEILKGRNGRKDVYIEPGDVIVVPETIF